jgi:hypothetical protein
MAVFTVWFLQDSNKHGRDDFKAKPSSVTLRILINHLQTLLLVGGLQNHGPELYREMVSAPAKVAEGGIVSSLNGFVECVLELNFFSTNLHCCDTAIALVCCGLPRLFLH